MLKVRSFRLQQHGADPSSGGRRGVKGREGGGGGEGGGGVEGRVEGEVGRVGISNR